MATPREGLGGQRPSTETKLYMGDTLPSWMDGTLAGVQLVVDRSRSPNLIGRPLCD